MAIISEILERLRDRNPSLSVRVEGATLTVDPGIPEGFAVWFHDGGEKYTVGFDGWHEHFDSLEEALDCFAFGLGGDCRLKVAFRRSFPYRWTLEVKENGGWREESTVGLLLFPFWRRSRTIYRMNRPVTGASATSQTGDNSPLRQ
jgi:hypothetical protein